MAIELTDPSLTKEEYRDLFWYLMDWGLLPEPVEPEPLVIDYVHMPKIIKKEPRRIVNKWVIEKKANILKKVSRNLMRDFKLTQ